MGKSSSRNVARALVLTLLAASAAHGAAVTTTLKAQSGAGTAAAAATGSSKSGNGTSSSDSLVLHINSVTDFCVFAPPQPNSTIADSERIEVAWCTQPGRGGRLIPDGALLGAHFVKTPDYVQITGFLQGTMLNIAAGDSGGELDNHGYDGKGNPVGGSVAGYTQFSNFMSDGQFCIKACTGPNARSLCQHIYDTLGCDWNMPGDYSQGAFTNCAGADTEPAGVYGSSTFTNSASATVPPAHTPGATSLCTTVASPTNGATASSVIVSSSSVLSSMTSLLTSAASPSVANVLASSMPSSVAALAVTTTSSSSTMSSSPTGKSAAVAQSAAKSFIQGIGLSTLLMLTATLLL